MVFAPSYFQILQISSQKFNFGISILLKFRFLQLRTLMTSILTLSDHLPRL